MQEEKTEGIVLRSQDYKERHRLITLFTPQGLISLIIHNISRKNTHLLSLTSPFCHADYSYQRGRSELLKFTDGTILSDHLILRKSLKTLQTAGSLAQAILTSQMAGKPAPALFLLYKSYHNQVPYFDDKEVLLGSFLLKLLRHEGLLTLSPSLYEEKSFYSDQMPGGGFRFSRSEWDLVVALAEAQQFSKLSEITLPPSLSKKIDALFLSYTAH